ncbi:MAG: hypothetical protein H6545_01650 [Bacteroidales bacterium]|nr:hypothetical protein [Bacteroidales bacterium]
MRTWLKQRTSEEIRSNQGTVVRAGRYSRPASYTNGIHYNAQMTPTMILNTVTWMIRAGRAPAGGNGETMLLSARAYDHILKVSRPWLTSTARRYPP